MKVKRIFAAFFCVALVLSLSAVVFATPSTLLIERFYGGYDCYGYGSFTSSEGKATFQTYTNNPSHVPESECTCTAFVALYDSDEDACTGTATASGNTSALARAKPVTISGRVLPFDYIYCDFTFLGVLLGGAELH